MKIEMPNEVKLVLDKLKENGYEGYLVGGCVRDSIMNRVPNDWDITTNAKPDEIMNIFDKVIPTGIDYGTVTVLINDYKIEVTTYRIDGEYSDGRCPDSVQFTNTLEEDLKRRDFTINAMAYNDEDGLIDLFNGMEHIREKLIVFVGDADERIDEDALRMIRAIRFATQLEFRLSIKAYGSIMSKHKLILTISKERINSELNKILTSNNPQIGLITMKNTNMLYGIITQLVNCDVLQNNKHHVFTILNHMFMTCCYSKNKLNIRMASLLHDIAKPKVLSTDENGVDHYYGHDKLSSEMSREILQKLRYSKDFINNVSNLIYYHGTQIEPTKKSVKRMLNKLDGDIELFRDLIELKMADSLAQNPKYMREKIIKLNDILYVLDEIIKDDEAFTLKQLKINGNDLMGHLDIEGKAVGEMLNDLLELVINGYIENDKDELIDEALKIWLCED